MSCDVASLPFQAHANYGTWSIDFGSNTEKNINLCTKLIQKPINQRD